MFSGVGCGGVRRAGSRVGDSEGLVLGVGVAEGGEHFVKGGLGCLGAFLAIGLLVVLAGGTMRIDAGGAIFLFVIGGGIGLLYLWAKQKGRDEARRNDGGGGAGG